MADDELRGWKAIGEALKKSTRTAMRYGDPAIAQARGQRPLPVYLLGSEVAIGRRELEAWQASRRRAYRPEDESVDLPCIAVAS